jgi:hypothetical protein
VVFVVAFVMTVSSVANLQAHENQFRGGSKDSAAEIEKHRKLDFGFEGFDRLNNQLQKDFKSFDFKASAEAYTRSLALAPAANSHLVGQWSPVLNLPIVAIHNAVLPNGKVLMWDSVSDLPSESYALHNTTRAIIWDPSNGSATRHDVNTGFNLFCAGHAALPDGRQFLAGGNLNSNLDGLDTIHTFNPFDTSWNLPRSDESGRTLVSVGYGFGERRNADYFGRSEHPGNFQFGQRIAVFDDCRFSDASIPLVASRSEWINFLFRTR